MIVLHAPTRVLRKGSSQTASPTEQVMIVQRRESALIECCPYLFQKILFVCIHTPPECLFA